MSFHSSFKIDYTTVALATLLMAVAALMPEVSLAASTTYGSLDNTSGLGGTLCAVVKTLQGPVARGLAAIAIIFLGFSLFLGKISWGIALALAIGIGAVFGAPGIVKVLAGESGNDCPA